MADDVMFKSATEQAELVRSGELPARELVEASLAAIDRLNDELNAVVTRCDERALAEADAVQACDERPLAGVPLLVKDLGALTEGVRTTMGMRALEDWIPDEDSATVRRLRAAGAIVVGKTNLPELGILPVSEPLRFGGGRGHGRDRARQRRRRLDPHSGLVLRARWAQAKPRTCVLGAAPRGA